MDRHQFEPKLHKRLVLKHDPLSVFSVNGLAVRNFAKPDEEFGNFGTSHEFPNLIPDGEVWISEKLAPVECVFFIANALTKLAHTKRGESSDTAYDAGLKAERT